MARKRKDKKSHEDRGLTRRVGRVLWRVGFWAVALVLLWIIAYRFLPVPTTAYMLSEARRIGTIDQTWRPLEEISPNLQRAVVAAEDANFCAHWGFDMSAIRDAISDGAQRGASTLSQQTVKNAFLWHGRNWGRKALEAALTPVVELIWPKSRVLEVYLNIAEFNADIFGAEAAAQHYFGVSAADLTLAQAARLAAVLPAPKDRSAANPSPWLLERAASIADGAATIANDRRDDCFAN